LTVPQDQSIQQELLRRNDLAANVCLLLRHTGMRIGECVDLSWDCLRNVAPDRWAIHSRAPRQVENGTHGAGRFVRL
jgi:integrase